LKKKKRRRLKKKKRGGNIYILRIRIKKLNG